MSGLSPAASRSLRELLQSLGGLQLGSCGLDLALGGDHQQIAGGNREGHGLLGGVEVEAGGTNIGSRRLACFRCRADRPSSPSSKARASELLKLTARPMFKPGNVLKPKPSAWRLTLSVALAQAAIELRQDVAQLLEARRLGLGRGLTAEDDSEVVLETAVDGVLDAEIQNAGRKLGGGNAAGERTLGFRGESNWSSDCGTLSGTGRRSVAGRRREWPKVRGAASGRLVELA